MAKREPPDEFPITHKVSVRMDRYGLELVGTRIGLGIPGDSVHVEVFADGVVKHASVVLPWSKFRDWAKEVIG